MQRQDMREQQLPSGRVSAALSELVEFSLNTSRLLFSSSTTPEPLAVQLVTWLAALCGAQRGELLFASPNNAASGDSAFSGQPSFLLIAHMSLGDAEGGAPPVDVCVPQAPVFQWSTENPSRLIWHRTLPLSPAKGQTAEVSHKVSSNGKASSPANGAGGIIAHAFFVLEWQELSDASQDAYPPEIDQAMKILPLLENGIDACMTHLLLASLWHTSQPSLGLWEEILPAELLSTISHEFRSPLTTIKGYATTLLQREHQIVPAERREFLEAIKQASSRLEHLVNRFLELTQFETHAYKLVPAPVDLVALAKEALTAAGTTVIQHTPRAAMPGSFTHLVLHIEQEEKNAQQEPYILCGDRRLLRLMLDVLLENALLYSPPDRAVTVGIRSGAKFSEQTAFSKETKIPGSQAVILPARFTPDETVTEIWVVDQGRGLAPHDLTRIFQRFSRVDTSLTREVGGLGLGLTLCKYVVALHQGMLWVESEVGVGSAFHVVLPQGASSTIE